MSQWSHDEIIWHQDEPFIDEITSLNDYYFENHTEFVLLPSLEDEEEDSETPDISVGNYSYSIQDYQQEFEYRYEYRYEVNRVFKTKTCCCSKLHGSTWSTQIEFSYIPK